MAIESSITPGTPARNRRAGQGIALLAVIAMIGLFVYGLNSSTQSHERVEAGKAPDFSLTSFDGQLIKLSNLQGKVVVVNFWATWCLECRNEAADLQQVYRQYQNQNVVFLGVDYLDQEPMNQNYLKEFGVTYPSGPDLQGRIYRAFRVQGLPETFVIDPQGSVSRVFVGATNAAGLQAAIQPLVKSKS